MELTQGTTVAELSYGLRGACALGLCPVSCLKKQQSQEVKGTGGGQEEGAALEIRGLKTKNLPAHCQPHHGHTDAVSGSFPTQCLRKPLTLVKK